MLQVPWKESGGLPSIRPSPGISWLSRLITGFLPVAGMNCALIVFLWVLELGCPPMAGANCLGVYCLSLCLLVLVILFCVLGLGLMTLLDKLNVPH